MFLRLLHQSVDVDAALAELLRPGVEGVVTVEAGAECRAANQREEWETAADRPRLPLLHRKCDNRRSANKIEPTLLFFVSQHRVRRYMRRMMRVRMSQAAGTDPMIPSDSRYSSLSGRNRSSSSRWKVMLTCGTCAVMFTGAKVRPGKKISFYPIRSQTNWDEMQALCCRLCWHAGLTWCSRTAHMLGWYSDCEKLWLCVTCPAIFASRCYSILSQLTPAVVSSPLDLSNLPFSHPHISYSEQKHWISEKNLYENYIFCCN